MGRRANLRGKPLIVKPQRPGTGERWDVFQTPLFAPTDNDTAALVFVLAIGYIANSN
jgi:hypothetical protein